MSKEEARIILSGLIPDGFSADRASNKARAEIRAALETVLRLVEKERS